LYKIYGAPGFFEHLRGEFAFVLYNSRKGSKRAIAARERFVIKPLVWTVVEDRLLIASEAKAFIPMGWKAKWDIDVIASTGWMLDERTLFEGVRKLLPGHWMEVTEEKGVEAHLYWDAV
jgi:asparagine synthase (glutamine-hydrolysing)